jgi:hypothetical protein
LKETRVTNHSLVASEQAQVQRTVALLKRRGSADLFKKLAVEKKINETSPKIVALAKAHLNRSPGQRGGHETNRAPAGRTTGGDHLLSVPAQSRHPSSLPTRAVMAGTAGEVTFEPDRITVSKSQMAQFTAARGEAQAAIGREVDRYVQTVQQGHREGYAKFRVWYRQWEKAKDESSAELAKKICGFLLEKGIALIFPEEEVFITILKAAAVKGYGLASDNLGKIEKGDIESFLDTLWAAEESEITGLLDAHDRFFQDKPDEVDAAVESFMEARNGGWDTTEKLPPQTLSILQGLGVGTHGTAAASVITERVLSAHIESVLHADPDVVAGAGGANLGIMAEVSALRQMQALPQVDNREKIYQIELGLPEFFRTMVDINNEPGVMLHIRLGIDQDEADDIVKSRNKDGPFRSSDDLLHRKVLASDELKKVEGRIVCH